MKKLIILLFVIISTMSCKETVRDTNTYFVDETFTITETTEREMVIDGYTKNVRVWKIQRDKIINDTIYIGTISDKGRGYIITDELWALKTVGDRIYFDYILRKRFAPTVLYKEKTNENLPTIYNTEVTIPVKKTAPVYINMNKLEIERRMLDIEREILSLQREYETLRGNIL